MPTLHWIGKEKVINHHLNVPFKVLQHQYGFTNGTQNNTETNSGNKIIHGDNLEALKSLLPEYEGKIKCIYIDPPYNTGNENWVYNDNVNDPKLNKWLGKVVGKEVEDLTRHDKWLCMMYPRLKLLHKLLAEDGAIFISIDDNEQANLKLICDEIFGGGNFVAIFYWKRTSTPPSLSNIVRKKFEPLICYQKSNMSKVFNGGNSSGGDMPLLNAGNASIILRFNKNNVSFKIPDGHYKSGKYNKIELMNDIQILNGQSLNDIEIKGEFKWTQNTLDEESKNGTKYFIKSNNFSIRYLRDETRTKTPSNIISKEECNVETNEHAAKQIEDIFENKLFSFSKPISLIEYIINFLCDKSSIILDSFAGSGTTAHAVLNLNKQDGGNRKFICIEMEDYAETITAERVKRVINGYANNQATNGSFDYYTLGQTLFLEDGNLNELLEIEKIRQYIYFTETKTNLPTTNHTDNAYFLGIHNDTAYYFFYQQNTTTTLHYDFLSTIKTYAQQYVIYADNCLLTLEFMQKHHIVFKKIPRDINKF